MQNELLNSRFFKTDDKRMDKVVFTLPSHWWSRFYEYAWAAEFCKETDVVLDAACGIVHPFKFYLSDYCKSVHAVDNDEKIIDFMEIGNKIEKTFGENAKAEYLEKYTNPVNFKHAELTELPYKNSMFDKIFCISALEHLPAVDQAKALKELFRVSKKDGKVILTLDHSMSEQYPDSIDMDSIEKLANDSGFKIAGEKDSSIPQNAINWDGVLYCYRMVLVKKKAGE